MPDPTPTPDTLRAAVQAERDNCNWLAMRSTTERQDAFLGVAARLTAALAASPAPTDTPDEWRPMERPREFDVDHGPMTVHTFVEAPDDAASYQDAYARPAAVTAPREDDGVMSPDEERLFLEGLRSRVRRAATAVERATPGPDTLAALIPHYDWCVNPGDDDEWCSCWPVRLTVAHALIAAGVTLNQTAPGA